MIHPAVRRDRRTRLAQDHRRPIASRIEGAAPSSWRSRSSRSPGLWALSWVAVHYGFWWGLLLVIPTAGFLLRLFMIQHDCGHGSFFAHRHSDDWTGRAIGVLTLTPYDYWRRAHAAHHASAGNLDERGVGDITTLTVAEYRALSFWGRLGYRLYRHPLVMFGIGPIWLFLFKQRLPFGMMRSGATPWVSTMATNLAIAILAAGLIWLIGIVPFLLVHLPTVDLAGAAGVWLFYVQHQFEETHWSKSSGMAIPVCRAQRLVALRPAGAAQMADRQYRHPSCPSSVEQGPVLPAAGSAQGFS